MSCGCRNKISSSNYDIMLSLAKKTASIDKGDVVLVKVGDCYKIYRPSQWSGEVVKTIKYYQKSGYIKAV